MYYEEKDFNGMRYIVRYPDGYKQGEKYPVLMFLHGAGTRGTDINVLRNNLFFTLTETAEKFPFVSIAPLCHKNSWFDLFETLCAFTKYVFSADFTNPEQLYLMGNSMGGYGTWALAMSLPEYFAAIVPICGGGMYWNAARLVNVPVWAFHGAKDNTVFLEESEKMVNSVNAKGGNAKLTVYPERMHDSWTDTFKNPETFAWLLSHTNSNAKTLKDDFVDGKIYG